MEQKLSALSPQSISIVALSIGEQILMCGGEIGRVEDTIERICKAYGAARVDVFAITSLIVLTVTMPDGTLASNNHRVRGQSTDLYRLEKLNALSRQICRDTPAFDQVQKQLDDISNTKNNPGWYTVLGGAFAASGFAVFFGGTLLDGLGAALVSLAVWIMGSFKRPGANLVAYSVIVSTFAGFVCILLVHFGIGTHVDKLMIGSIMLLIPGIAMTNSMRDLLSGDIIAGMLRLAEAFLVACAIAIGFAISTILLGGIL